VSDFFNVVHRTVAANPVARAIAKKRIESAIRDFLIECYFTEDGADAAGDYLAAARVLTVSIRLCEQAGTQAPGVIRGALSCCQQAAERNFVWKRIDAAALDAGIVAAEQIVKKATAADLQRAWAFVMDIEKQAA
jgi:hypothetical protein